MKLNEAIGRWIIYRSRMCELKLVAGSTLLNQTGIAHGIATSSIGEKELEDVRKSDIELWMGERLQTCAPVTVRGEMNVLRQILNWCVDESRIVTKPRFPTLSVSNTEKPLPSDEAFLWVLRNVRGHVSAALEFMMLTGLSPHELERLEKRDAGARPGGLIMTNDRHSFIEPLEVVRIGFRDDFPVKTPSRKRVVPLNDRARTLWLTYSMGLLSTAKVWPSGDAMQKAIRRSMLEDDAIPIGTRFVTPKMMRKWFASKVAGEQPEHVLQKLMGHAPGSPITRRHYVRSTDEQVNQAVQGVKL